MNNRSKQKGFLISTEITLLSSMLVAGVTVGMATLRDSTLAEMNDVSEAIGSLDQSFSFSGVRNRHGTAYAAGSGFRDSVDKYAGDGEPLVFIDATYTEGSTQ